MIRPNAWRVVAAMANKHAGRDRTVFLGPCETVCLPKDPAQVKLAVTCRMARTDPHPAFAGLIHALPKLFVHLSPVSEEPAADAVDEPYPPLAEGGLERDEADAVCAVIGWHGSRIGGPHRLFPDPRSLWRRILLTHSSGHGLQPFRVSRVSMRRGDVAKSQNLTFIGTFVSNRRHAPLEAFNPRYCAPHNPPAWKKCRFGGVLCIPSRRGPRFHRERH